MKKLLILTCACFLLSACGNTQKANKEADADSTAVADMHNAENSLDYAGTYKGTFPAADCPGIEMTLILNADKTFKLHASYLERNSAYDEKGTYSLEENILTLTEEGGTTSFYRVEENKLRHLMADKQPVTGELADYYILKKEIDGQN